ncbi:hypothetical protein BC834DRAFT_969422 [Gloeopeniophorella convolvens]|nr:hypothetical protein BC834DRAFT_969422 [Gloeopeniophorella convolvens]
MDSHEAKAPPHHPSRQSSTDQLAAITNFLDELETKTPIKHLQKQTDSNTALLDTINALIAVGAFIAGVQAQMISVTQGTNTNALGKATNWFGFVGLTLDLIGTTAGVARALLLQHTIRRTHRLAARLTGQIDGARHEVRMLEARGADLSADPRLRNFLVDTMRSISHVMMLLAEDGGFGVQTGQNLSEIEAAAAAALDALGPRPRRVRVLHQLRHPFHVLVHEVMSQVGVEGLGQVPVAAMAGGALCLLTSVVMFAGASQPRGIWVSCAAIIIATLVWTLVPTTSSQKLRRAALYDRVEETLQQSPPVAPPVFSSAHHWHSHPHS